MNNNESLSLNNKNLSLNEQFGIKQSEHKFDTIEGINAIRLFTVKKIQNNPQTIGIFIGPNALQNLSEQYIANSLTTLSARYNFDIHYIFNAESTSMIKYLQYTIFWRALHITKHNPCRVDDAIEHLIATESANFHNAHTITLFCLYDTRRAFTIQKSLHHKGINNVNIRIMNGYASYSSMLNDKGCNIYRYCATPLVCASVYFAPSTLASKLLILATKHLAPLSRIQNFASKITYPFQTFTASFISHIVINTSIMLLSHKASKLPQSIKTQILKVPDTAFYPLFTFWDHRHINKMLSQDPNSIRNVALTSQTLNNPSSFAYKSNTLLATEFRPLPGSNDGNNQLKERGSTIYNEAIFPDANTHKQCL